MGKLHNPGIVESFGKLMQTLGGCTFFLRNNGYKDDITFWMFAALVRLLEEKQS